MDLKNKVALITGGTSGIGAASAIAFRRTGASVIVTGSNPRTLEAARASLDGIDVMDADAADPGASASLINAVRDKYGKIDVLFCNAGIAQFAPIEAVDEAFYDAQFAVNTRGLYFTVKHALPAMPDGASIILTTSAASSGGAPNMSVYAATKAAVRAFGRNLAAELAPRNIRVNVISPGPIDTPIIGKTGMPPDEVEQMRMAFAQRVPLGRFGRSEEVAAAALFLASDAASFMTGSELAVDGGVAQV